MQRGSPSIDSRLKGGIHKDSTNIVDTTKPKFFRDPTASSNMDKFNYEKARQSETKTASRYQPYSVSPTKPPVDLIDLEYKNC